MKIADIVNEVLDENEDFKAMSRVEKTLARTAIKHGLGKDNIDIPDNEVKTVKQMLSGMIKNMPMSGGPDVPQV